MNEITIVIITLVSWTISAVLDSERDTIQYKPRMAWSQGKWWLGSNYLIRELLMRSNGQWWVKPVYYLLKYPFSFIINGWHLCKSTSIVCLMLPLAVLNPFFDWFWVITASYILYGIAFNFSYDY